MQQPGSLYLRLVAPLGVTLLAAMVLAFVIALTWMSNAINARLDARLANAVSVLAAGNFPLSEELLERLDGLVAARLLLLDADGEVVRMSSGGETSRVAAALTGRLEAATDTAAIDTISAGDESWRVAVRMLPSGRDDRFRHVVAAAPLAESRVAVRDAAALLAAAMLAASILIGGIGSYFVRSITRPISELAGMAGRLADGERRIQTSIVERNEIGTLARALNDLSTRLEDYENELARRARLSGLGDLAARVAHEVRNPLTAMKMQLQMLEERVRDDERAGIGAVLDEVRRLEMVVESTLALGSTQTLDPQPTDPGQLIRDVLDLLRPSFEHRRINLRADIADMSPADLDRDRLKQVLLNLLNNAADEIGSAGEVQVTAMVSDEPRQLCIDIEDDGPGLPDNGPDSGSAKPFGLGLGLTISREIVARHGGTLQGGKSRQLGGAHFAIRIPVPIMTDQSS